MSAASGLLLLDTSIVIHIARPTQLGNQLVGQHPLHQRAERPLISVVTLGELMAFARKRNWGAPKMARLRETLQQLVPVDINSSAVIDKYAEVDALCEARGWSLGKNDLWIAATAAATGSLLLTTDKDFNPLHEVNFLRRVWYDPVASPPSE
jgi:tRNA(fMet)-specific endonuclease VapC